MSVEAVSFEPPRGMRDFYPADMRRRERIFAAYPEAAAAYGLDTDDS